MRSLKLPAEQRKAELTKFAQDDPNHLAILNTLASVYDERLQLQQQRDTLTKETQTLSEKMKAAGLDVSRIDANRGDWSKLKEEALKKTLTDFLGAKAEPAESGVHSDLPPHQHQARGGQEQAGGPRGRE